MLIFVALARSEFARILLSPSAAPVISSRITLFLERVHIDINSTLEAYMLPRCAAAWRPPFFFHTHYTPPSQCNVTFRRVVVSGIPIALTYSCVCACVCVIHTRYENLSWLFSMYKISPWPVAYLKYGVHIAHNTHAESFCLCEPLMLTG